MGVSGGLIGFPTWREAHFSQDLQYFITSLRIPGHQ